jgi:polyphosphate kinase 2 (PPK2 family)
MTAAEEMIGRTNTAYAPWKIIPSDDKYFSRVTVLDEVIDKIKKAL